jgi:methyltransferase-like protein 6
MQKGAAAGKLTFLLCAQFFKDRHYLDKEWGHYIGGKTENATCNSCNRVVLEVGCGVGNTIFPLLAEFPQIFLHACDFSPRAVNLVKAHQEYSEQRVNAFVCDVTAEDLSAFIAPSSVDVVTLVHLPGDKTSCFFCFCGHIVDWRG